MQPVTLRPSDHTIQIPEENIDPVERISFQEAINIADETIEALKNPIKNHLEDFNITKFRFQSILSYKQSSNKRYVDFFINLTKNHKSIFKVDSKLQERIHVQESPSFQVKISKVAFDALQNYHANQFAILIAPMRNQSCWQRYDGESILKKTTFCLLITGAIALGILGGIEARSFYCGDC